MVLLPCVNSSSEPLNQLHGSLLVPERCRSRYNRLPIVVPFARMELRNVVLWTLVGLSTIAVCLAAVTLAARLVIG
jgi:hypothetical protein